MQSDGDRRQDTHGEAAGTLSLADQEMNMDLGFFKIGIINSFYSEKGRGEICV